MLSKKFKLFTHNYVDTNFNVRTKMFYLISFFNEPGHFTFENRSRQKGWWGVEGESEGWRRASCPGRAPLRVPPPVLLKTKLFKNWRPPADVESLKVSTRQEGHTFSLFNKEGCELIRQLGKNNHVITKLRAFFSGADPNLFNSDPEAYFWQICPGSLTRNKIQQLNF